MAQSFMQMVQLLPVCEQFEFLWSTSFKKSEILGEGFRLKTVKFRGQISQGLVQSYPELIIFK